MRLRITLVFVAVLTISLLLAGTVSLLLVRHAEVNSARTAVLHEAAALAATTRHDPNLDPSTYIPLIQSVTRLKVGPTVAVSSTNGHVDAVEKLPGIPSSLINAQRLADDQAVSGVYGEVVFAIAPLFAIHLPHDVVVTTAIALENHVTPASNDTWYFLLAGGIPLLITAALAALISRRISGPLLAASSAAHDIAEGDLATRLVLSRRNYPEVVGLANSLNTMAENLERSRNLERQFLLSISHDLRTPLTSIRGYAEAIAEGVAQDLARAGEVLVSESDRLSRLIGDLLDLARLEACQFSLHLEAIDLPNAVASACEALRYEFTATGIAMSVDVPSESMIIEGDGDRLSQIVANLVENALNFARARVDISVGGDDETVSLCVEDDGVGISGADLPHVFERHFTSGHGKSRHSGSGLGLAIVSELTAAMNGHLAVDSPLSNDGGTRMTIAFPRHADGANPT